MKRRPPKEFEIKLDLAEDELELLAASPLLEQHASGPARHARLRSTYFDTEDQRLRAAGASLRLRAVDGHCVQTVKLGTGLNGGVSNPIEIESPADGEAPDLATVPDRKVAAKLRKLVGNAPLAPVFVTDIDRRSHDIRLEGVEAELALDHGRIVAGPRTLTIVEAELELKSGRPEALLPIAERLFAGVPLRFGHCTKAERGFRLLDGEPTAPGPVTAWQPRIGPGCDIARLFARIADSAVDQILANWRAIALCDDPECAHQLRIGIRRLRTALRIFRPEIDGEALRALNGELREIGRIVGRLRDSDVLVTDIAAPALAAIEDAKAARRLEAFLVAHAAATRQEVRAELGQLRWNPVLLRLALLPSGQGWTPPPRRKPAAAKAAAVMAKCWKRVDRRGRRIEALTIEERHQLRKDLKTLRYATEFLAPLLPARRAAAFLKALKKLQTRFGYLNDVAMAATLPGLVASGMPRDPGARQAASFILGWHSGHAGHESEAAAARWSGLKGLAGFWKR